MSSALSEPECNWLLDALAGHRLFMLYKLAITTGMRESELIGLSWEMIDWERSEIKPTSQLKWLRETKSWERLSLKNRKRRTIPLDGELLAELRRGDEWHENGLVFPTSVGTPIIARNLMRQLDGMTAKAELGKLTFHQLRHTAGSLMLQGGKTMTTVSKLLEHSSVGVTEKIYEHSYEDEKREAVASLSRRLRRAEGGR